MTKKSASPAKVRPPKREDGLPPRYGQVADMLRNPKGTTIADLQTAFKIEAHTARAMLSILRKKHGLAIETDRQPGGAVYSITSPSRDG